MNIFEKKIILASKSPRRKQLLEQAGFNFTIHALDVDESFPDDMPKVEVAPYLARKKAQAAKEEVLTKDSIILAADSVVILNNKIYEKPRDYDDAVYILRQLSGQLHQVITGVCLLSEKHEKTFAGKSDVQFLPLSDEEIHYYVTHFQPFDKAGAYAIQEWIGLCKIAYIKGTYANIMGLPVEMVYDALKEF